jgi:methylamine utilization protein MauE
MTAAALDPAVRLTLRAALVLLFAWAAGHKLRDGEAFRAALGNYSLVPQCWLRSVSMLLVGLELSVAVGLCIPGVAATAACAAAGLLALYTGAIGINLIRGRRDIDCGCAGPMRRQPISAALVLRNAALAGAALACALPASSRAFTWIDGITVAASVATIALLYAAIDGLLVTVPRIRTMNRGTSHQSRVTSHA